MKFPTEIRTYCPYCRQHTSHKARLPSKGRPRTLAWGNLQHARKIRGYVGKVAGEKPVRKQGKRPRLLLECTQCKKRSERVLGSRTREKVEIKS
ncbi:MAG: 50S ribosomal protein L44e [Candidatus Micrarchaeia archaeon]